ncbi:transmembrane protease serine 11G-like [Dromiciops gliroides]|uniref:transmembrane protease serine 11G-like n=1 Tax=Dromiciops gliroides TaxID=33562 RepID=UPI001CC7F727|nr:transmembrane protease serine 11G-like [Dromiciops gliroides]
MSVFSFLRPPRLGFRKVPTNPWIIGLTVVAIVLVLALVIGLLVYFLVLDQKPHYYQTSFRIPSIEYSNELEAAHSEVKARITDQVDNIFKKSSLEGKYMNSHVIKFRPSTDGLKADVLLKFQFASSVNENTIKMMAENILHQNLKDGTQSLELDGSSPHLQVMNTVQAEHLINNGCGLGIDPSFLTERIANGGTISQRGSWPWQASLQVDRYHICGASLISDQWLLTAAHCFNNNKNPRRWTATFGTTLSPALMRRNIQSIIIHENYASHKHEDDIAVVLLSTPVTFSENVRTACLPEATFEALPHSNVVVTGWGAFKASGQIPNKLREAKVEIISNDVCNRIDVYGGAVSSGMICAGYLSGKIDACEGDSGGPLVIPNNRLWYIIGIVSWGIDCGKENKPGLYTKVTRYRDWIKSKTNL